MDLDNTSSNVYALFPGIDTTPFATADPSERAGDQPSDAGWSTEVPERVLVDEVALPADPPRLRSVRWAWHPTWRHRRVRGFLPASAWVALALLTGVGLAAGRAILITPRRHESGPIASAGRGHPRQVQATTVVREARTATRANPTRTPSRKHHRRPRHPARSATPPHHAAAVQPTQVAYTPPTDPSPATTSSYAPAPVEPVQSSAAPSDPAAPASAASSREGSQPAGPSGLGGQVGNSCDPKCQ